MTGNDHDARSVGSVSYGTNDRLRIVVLGYIVRWPIGGSAWHHLQYVMGLAQLGHDVYFAEDSDDYHSCYNPDRDVTDTDPSYGLKFVARTFDRVGLGDRWVYHDSHTSTWFGPYADRVHEIGSSADILLNLSGVNPIRPWFSEIPVRVLVDTDPVFMQVRHLKDPNSRDWASQHTAFLSFGENLGLGLSAAPQDGFPWTPTRQPVVLSAWPVQPGQPDGRFTTVMQWDSYPAEEYEGRRYGMKSDSFGPYLDLPNRSTSAFEVALGGPTAPPELLRENGWIVRDPLELTRDPWTFQGYIQGSKAEFSVAKHGYVVGHSGWFSERSAVYLASGRPVLVQETGFSDWLETGSGVISFATREEAFCGLEEINHRYDFHCRAAREIAEEYFDSRKVLARLLDDVTCATGSPSPASR
jgi:hypothetical protein